MPYNNIISRTDAAALIPEDVVREVIQGVSTASATLTKFRRVTLSRAQQRLPVLSVLPTAYFVNGDTGLKQTTEVNWSNKYLDVEELAAIVPIPQNVLDDADFDIWGEVRPLLEAEIGRVLDAAVFFGTNKPASWPAAIEDAAIAAGHDVQRGTNLAATGGIMGDISDAMAFVEADGFPVDGIVAPASYKSRYRMARSTTGDRLGDIAEVAQMTTYAMPGLWPTASGAAELFVGDFRQGIVGVRKDMSFDIFREGVIQDGSGTIIYNLLQQDMAAMRVTFRVAFQVPNPITYDQPTEASRYPFAIVSIP